MKLDFEIPELPYKKESNKKWSFFNTYNIRTIRDLFVFISQKPSTEEELYDAMERKIVKPPRDRWSIANSSEKKDRDRQKLEYLHATRFLGFVKEVDANLKVDLEEFCDEKKEILAINGGRNFSLEKATPILADQEVKSILPIILNYSRAKEYLWWFLDFTQFNKAEDFNLDDLKTYGQPIYLNKPKDQKASEIMYRCIDKKLWKIPYDEYVDKERIKRTNDYTRSVTYIFPAWFEDLKVINRIPVLKEFGFMEGNWDLHYPIKVHKVDIDTFEAFVLNKFNNELKKTNVIWIPIIIYESVLKFQLAIEDIKGLLVRLYEERKPRYIMERSSLQVMRYSNNLRLNNRHQDLFLNYRDFTRNNFIINN